MMFYHQLLCHLKIIFIKWHLLNDHPISYNLSYRLKILLLFHLFIKLKYQEMQILKKIKMLKNSF